MKKPSKKMASPDAVHCGRGAGRFGLLCSGGLHHGDLCHHRQPLDRNGLYGDHRLAGVRYHRNGGVTISAICNLFFRGHDHLHLPLSAAHAPPYISPILPAAGERSTRKTLLGATGFVAGFTLIFVALGALAGTVGGFLRDIRRR